MMVFPRSVVRKFVEATCVSPGSLVIDATPTGSAFTSTLESLGVIIDRFDAETLSRRGRAADCVLFSASSDECSPPALSWRLPVLLAQLRPRGCFIGSDLDAENDHELAILHHILATITQAVPACRTEQLTLKSGWMNRRMNTVRDLLNWKRGAVSGESNQTILRLVRFRAGLRPMSVDEWAERLDQAGSERRKHSNSESSSTDRAAA